MKFSGPTHDGIDWNDQDVIEITYDSIEELKKNNSKYFKSQRAIVRTSTSAKAGDKKRLIFHLPGGVTFGQNGSIEKIKAQNGKPFSLALFKLENFGEKQEELISDALKPSDEEIELGEGFDIPLTQDYDPPEEEIKETPADKNTEAVEASPVEEKKEEAKPADTSSRSAEDSAMIEAFLSDGRPRDEELVKIELPEELQGPAGDLLMPKGEEDEENADILEHKKFVVAFILVFTKSVQRAGYYGDTDHPEARKAKKGLYSLFRKIVAHHPEISFIRKAGKEPDVLIAGVVNEMITLGEIMPNAMAVLFIPKILEYLERRSLVSFSIKQTITEAKFERFITLLSQYSPEFRDNARAEGERFTQALLDDGVVEVSAVFDEDMISGASRKLPWQAELTISRLKKDLKMVPLLKNATEQELRDIKIKIFSDTIKPLRSPDFFITVLQNADLIMEDIEDSTILAGLDVEELMISGAEIDFLTDIAAEIVKRLSDIRSFRSKDSDEEDPQRFARAEKQFQRMADRTIDRFKDNLIDSTMDALELYYDNQLIEFDNLPVRVQQRIKDKKLTNAFLENSDEIFTRFNSPLSEKEFADFINRFQRVIPRLSERKEFLLVSKIIDSARKHLEDRNAHRKSLTKRLFDYIAGTHILSDLKEAFESEDRELRDMALQVFVSFGRQSVPMLLAIMKDHDDKWIRKKVIRTIIDIGQPAVQPMIGEMYKDDNPWYYTRNLVSILGDIGDKRLFGKLNLLVFHDHEAVREETLNTLYRIAPESCESHLIKALDDESVKVREKAIQCFGMLGSSNERVLNHYMDILEGKKEADVESVQIQVYRAIGATPKIDETRRKRIEEILTKTLEQEYKTGFMSLFQKSIGVQISGGIKMGICIALGNIGTHKKAMPLLNSIAKENDPVLAQQANEAIENIKARGA